MCTPLLDYTHSSGALLLGFRFPIPGFGGLASGWPEPARITDLDADSRLSRVGAPQFRNYRDVFDNRLLTRGTISNRHRDRSEEHTSELQSHLNLVCRLLLEKKKNNTIQQ